MISEEDRTRGGRALEALIKKRALELRLSMRGLARKSGVGTNTFYNWFSGKTAPRTRELQAVAEALEMDIDELWRAYQGRAGETAPAPAINPADLAAIRAEVAAGVAQGVVEALTTLRREGLIAVLGSPPDRPPRPSRRGSRPAPRAEA